MKAERPWDIKKILACTLREGPIGGVEDGMMDLSRDQTYLCSDGTNRV